MALEAIRETERQEVAMQQRSDGGSLLGTLLATPGLSKEDVLTFILDMIATGIDTVRHQKV